ncbi:MAG: hypothetical protein WCY88_03615 [Spongiibacteraceae bacterium]
MSVLEHNVRFERRLLGDTLAELALGLMDLAAAGSARATGIELRLPIELYFSADSGELTGDLPLYRRATAFDAAPAQITIRLAEEAL